MSDAVAAVEFAEKNKGRFVEELKALLRIPSISTDPERVGDVRRAAEFVAAELKRIGMENVRLIETSTKERSRGIRWFMGIGCRRVVLRLSFVMGTMMCSRQEPLDEWKSLPFEPTERDGNIYARGAVDDKGDVDACEGVSNLYSRQGRASCR